MATPGKGAYDPTNGLRGDVSEKKFADKPESIDGDDNCGRWERGNHIFLRVYSRQGEHGIPYNLLGYSRTKEGLTLRVAACLELEGQEEREGLWRVAVQGEGLDEIIRQIGKGIRTILKEGSEVNGVTRITKIEIQPWG